MNKIDFDNIYPKQKNTQKKSNQKAYKISVFIFALLMLLTASLLLYRYIILDREYDDLILANSTLQQEKEYLSTQLSKYEESYNSISADNKSLKAELEVAREEIDSLNLSVSVAKVLIDDLNKKVGTDTKTFNIGSSQEDVKNAMGEPNKIESEQEYDFNTHKYRNLTVWYYGIRSVFSIPSTVTFDESDKVIEWDEQNVALKVG